MAPPNEQCLKPGATGVPSGSDASNRARASDDGTDNRVCGRDVIRFDICDSHPQI
jgi:hypothetical protein